MEEGKKRKKEKEEVKKKRKLIKTHTHENFTSSSSSISFFSVKWHILQYTILHIVRETDLFPTISRNINASSGSDPDSRSNDRQTEFYIDVTDTNLLRDVTSDECLFAVMFFVVVVVDATEHCYTSIHYHYSRRHRHRHRHRRHHYRLGFYYISLRFISIVYNHFAIRIPKNRNRVIVSHLFLFSPSSSLSNFLSLSLSLLSIILISPQ